VAHLLARAIDVAIGVTLLWAVFLGLSRGEIPHDAGLIFVALQVVVAVLFVLRRAPRREGTWSQRALCLLSVPMPTLAFVFAPSLQAWPLHALVLFAIGGAGAAVSLSALGRSFGILPAVRGVVVRGPFDWVRHPTYASELLMVMACLLAQPAMTTLVIATTTVTLVVIRIRIEESLLLEDPSYADYAGRVRFRLVPLLW
jgi:protein-S-isoprenylcysteine O-methyltransferase Ste14